LIQVVGVRRIWMIFMIVEAESNSQARMANPATNAIVFVSTSRSPHRIFNSMCVRFHLLGHSVPRVSQLVHPA
jgi:hypothetical protein